MKQLRLGYGLIALMALLAGCSGGTQDSGGGASATSMALRGVVHGGQAPIVGSAVTLRAASQQGLSNATTVASATTDSNGNFNFTFTCPSPTAEMYVTSSSGNPGGGTNAAIRLMAILGPCQDLPNSATINELTTVAAAYTVNNFIGPSGCSDCGGGLPQSVTNIAGSGLGLTNAMGNAGLLVSALNGQVAPSLPGSAACSASSPPANCLTVKKLNTAANALAACVNSSGPTSAQCTQLFDCAVVGAVFTSSTACTPPSGAALPTDTLQAMLNIVRNPAKISVPGVDDTSSRDVVFSPAFSTHFTDYTLSLNLAAGGLDMPTNLAVDGDGDIWITNDLGNNVTELGANGAVLSGGSGFATDSNPETIAFDANGNAWIADPANISITVLNSAGSPLPASPITSGGISVPFGIAVSPDGDIWVADNDNGRVSRFTAAGVAVGSGYNTGTSSFAVAIDASGYVFVTNGGSNTVTQLSPSGVTLGTLSTGGLNKPLGAAIDINGNLWVANGGSASLTKITLANEGVVSAANITGGGLATPSGVAVDAVGNVWVANLTTVSEFNSAGTALSPSAGFAGAGLGNSVTTVITPGIDGSGNVWFANPDNNSVTVFFGAAAPTRTPLVAAISQGFVP